MMNEEREECLSLFFLSLAGPPFSGRFHAHLRMLPEFHQHET